MILEMTDHGLIAPVADPEAALDRGADVLRAHTKAIAAVLDAGRKPCRQRNGLPPPYVYRGVPPAYPDDDDLFHGVLIEHLAPGAALPNLPGWIDRMASLPMAA